MPLYISLTVANLLGNDLVSDASSNPIIEVKVGTVDSSVKGLIVVIRCRFLINKNKF